MKKKVVKKKKKVKGIQHWKKELDKIFSIYIRKKYARADGLAQCVTCRKWGRWQDMHAGHFIPGRTNGIRWEENCVHVQCMACNVYLKGNWPEYLKFMQEAYGQDVIDDLLKKKSMIIMRKTPELLELIALYDEKIKSLPH